jgi:hypothetical protein
MSTYTLYSDLARDTALDAVGGEMMGTQEVELLKQIFVAAGNGVQNAGVVVTGARNSPEGALKNLLTQLASLGIITDSTTAS